MTNFSAGKEVLSYCSKCKLTLAHIIQVMKGENHIGKVQCKTCKSIHAYKDPTNVKGKKMVLSTAGNRTTKTGQQSVTELWTEALNKSKAKSQSYSPQKKFIVGDIIDHQKFGPGIIEKTFDNNKIEVIFRHQILTLIHNIA